ncbi:hypothetical protein BDY24DRAFT_382733 [Mrakia frigida]|uniref:zinc finger MYND domain-containing protein n=1 Tax=Mrakia frigida TaxID=29902 RepID=UPI003FCBFF07
MSSEITSSTIATNFGLADGSYPRLIAHEKIIREDLLSDQVEDLITSLLPSICKVAEMRKIVDQLFEMENPRRSELMAEFCHSYLPVFIKAFRLAANPQTPVDPRFASVDQHYFGLLWALSSQPDLLRYIREHDEGSTLLVHAMQSLSGWISAFVSMLDSIPNWPYEVYPGASLCAAFRAVRSLIYFSSPPTSFTPELQSTSGIALLDDIEDLRELLSILPNDAVDLQGWRTMEREVVELRTVLEGKCEHKACAENRDRVRARLPWWTCEARDHGNCRKLKKGVEMMACGRCKAVRYCSTEHQKAHWKTHKKNCRTPIW